MLLEKLKEFAVSDAPAQGYPLFSTTFSPFGSNLSMIAGISGEISDIVQRGDSLLKNIPLKHKDVLPSIRASIVLRDIVLGKDVHDDVSKIMRAFIKSVDKLTSVYYVPKVEGSVKEQQKWREEGETLQARYDFLLSASTKSPEAVRQFEKEFYPDGQWDPELPDEMVEQKVDDGVVSLGNRRQRETLSRAFKETLQDDFTQNPIFGVQAMLGTPPEIEKAWAAVRSLGYTIDRNERVLSAVRTLSASLQNVVCPKSAKIYTFPAFEKPN